MIIFNEVFDDIVAISHVSYFVKSKHKNEGEIFELHEVIEKKLKHPSAPDEAYVYKYDVIFVCEITSYNKGDVAALILLQAAENNAANFMKHYDLIS